MKHIKPKYYKRARKVNTQIQAKPEPPSKYTLLALFHMSNAKRVNKALVKLNIRPALSSNTHVYIKDLYYEAAKALQETLTACSYTNRQGHTYKVTASVAKYKPLATSAPKAVTTKRKNRTKLKKKAFVSVVNAPPTITKPNVYQYTAKPKLAPEFKSRPKQLTLFNAA